MPTLEVDRLSNLLFPIIIYSDEDEINRWNLSLGRDIDAIAREPLWSNGLDYRHGTGHGIGHFLNVHEGKLFSYTVCI